MLAISKLEWKLKLEKVFEIQTHSWSVKTSWLWYQSAKKNQLTFFSNSEECNWSKESINAWTFNFFSFYDRRGGPSFEF
jgi:hypothetical protein